MTLPLAPRITQAEALRILALGCPDPADLLKFPFGSLLYDLWTKDGGRFTPHGRIVLESMNSLLGANPGQIVRGNPAKHIDETLRELQQEIGFYFGGFDDDIILLFRLAALYHDIGKYITRERHPTIGRYTMEYLQPAEKDSLRVLLGNREDYLQLLLVMIRDHDQFGVLNTGEGSYPILLSAATSLGNLPEYQKRTLASIMWLNIADMSGVPELDLNSDDLSTVIEDYEWFKRALDRSFQRHEHLADFVIREASDEQLVIRRISRLILEASRRVPSRYSELRQANPDTSELRVTELVRSQLITVFQTQNAMRDFAFQFTHVCKLDYAKRFFNRLVDFSEGPRVDDRERLLKSWAAERVETGQLIYAVLAILKRITSTYTAMVRSEGGSGNLIGVEMKDLSPENAPDKTTQICSLLLESHYPGLSWIMSDCPAWYF